MIAKRQHIVVVDDEEDILELVRFHLERIGYEVTGFTSGRDALDAAVDRVPDLIILDVMLPDLDGLEVCRRLRRHVRTANTPVIMLTARGDESDIVSGLELGADDYVPKPFSPHVLVARVRAVLRRRGEPVADPGDSVRVEDFEINPGRHEVIVDGHKIQLTVTEFQLLHLLARRPGWVYSREQILDEIRGPEVIVTDRTIDVQIAGLRKKLGDHGRYIETVRGVGYRFKG